MQVPSSGNEHFGAIRQTGDGNRVKEFVEVRKINVRRWSITSQKPFESVVAADSTFLRDLAYTAWIDSAKPVPQVKPTIGLDDGVTALQQLGLIKAA